MPKIKEVSRMVDFYSNPRYIIYKCGCYAAAENRLRVCADI